MESFRFIIFSFYFVGQFSLGFAGTCMILDPVYVGDCEELAYRKPYFVHDVFFERCDLRYRSCHTVIGEHDTFPTREACERQCVPKERWTFNRFINNDNLIGSGGASQTGSSSGSSSIPGLGTSSRPTSTSNIGSTTQNSNNLGSDSTKGVSAGFDTESYLEAQNQSQGTESLNMGSIQETGSQNQVTNSGSNSNVGSVSGTDLDSVASASTSGPSQGVSAASSSNSGQEEHNGSQEIDSEIISNQGPIPVTSSESGSNSAVSNGTLPLKPNYQLPFELSTFEKCNWMKEKEIWTWFKENPSIEKYYESKVCKNGTASQFYFTPSEDCHRIRRLCSGPGTNSYYHFYDFGSEQNCLDICKPMFLPVNWQKHMQQRIAFWKEATKPVIG